MCRIAEGSTLGWGAPRQKEERPGAMGREAKHLLSPPPHAKFNLNAIGSSRLTGIIC